MSRSKTIPVIALASLAISACGGDEKVSAGDYAGDICTAFTEWRDSIQERQGDLKKGLKPGISPEEGKDALADFLGEVVDRSDQLVEDVEEAGVPDAENGEDVADALEGAAKQARDELADAEEKVADLPTGSNKAFDKATDEFGDEIRTALGSVGDGLQDMESTEIETAFDEESACNS